MFCLSFCDAIEQWAHICNKYSNCSDCQVCKYCDFLRSPKDPFEWDPKLIAGFSDILEKEYKNAERN